MEKVEVEDVIFGKVLRKLRLSRKKSQEGLALDAALTRNYISLIELGQRRPTTKTLISLAKGLEMPISEIFETFEAEYFKTEHKLLHRPQ